ncbi:MAG: hypothetical protein AAGN46_16645 [Acidobacteriota bacterium]
MRTLQTVALIAMMFGLTVFGAVAGGALTVWMVPRPDSGWDAIGQLLGGLMLGGLGGLAAGVGCAVLAAPWRRWRIAVGALLGAVTLVAAVAMTAERRPSTSASPSPSASEHSQPQEGPGAGRSPADIEVRETTEPLSPPADPR